MVPNQDASLAEELSYYGLHKDEWVRSHAEEFVAVSGSTLVGFFPNFEKAFEAGLQSSRDKSAFLVKQVREQEPVFTIY